MVENWNVSRSFGGGLWWLLGCIKDSTHKYFCFPNKRRKFFSTIPSGDELSLIWKNIEEVINSEFVKNKLIWAWNVSGDLKVIWNIIWDCVLYNTLFKKVDDNDFFVRFIDELYCIYLNERLNVEEKNIEKAEVIARFIANYLDIELTDKNSKKIRKYFLKEYDKNWFVYHSFPSAYYESISKSWLQAINEKKCNCAVYSNIEKIQKIFISHWIYSALWWAWIYWWKWIYYDHRFWNILSHAILWPERFSRFTSSDHYAVPSCIIGTPFVLRDKVHCRKNVIDLCDNAWLNEDEKSEVVSFFEKSYDNLSSKGCYFSLIPKAKVWKSWYKVSEYVWYIPISKDDSRYVKTQYKELINTIRCTLWDWWNCYKEHWWNVYHENIRPSEMVIIKLPEISEIIKENVVYNSETMEQLINKQKIRLFMRKIKEVRKIAPDRVPDWIINSFDDERESLDSRENSRNDLAVKINEIFSLNSRWATEFSWDMIKYFNFYTDTIVPIISDLKKKLVGTEYEILQHDDDMNHWFNQHTKNVVIRWIFYALIKWIDPIPVVIACATHDLKHINIPWWWDKKHWPQAVPLVDIVVDEYNKVWTEKIDKKTVEQIKYAVENHMSDHWEPDSMPIAQCLDDADRTRIAWRDWYTEKFFSTDAAKILADWKKCEFIKYFQDIWIDYDTTSIQ